MFSEQKHLTGRQCNELEHVTCHWDGHLQQSLSRELEHVTCHWGGRLLQSLSRELEHVTCMHDVQGAGTCDLCAWCAVSWSLWPKSCCWSLLYITLFSDLKQTRCACMWCYLPCVSTDLLPRACAMSWSVWPTTPWPMSFGSSAASARWPRTCFLSWVRRRRRCLDEQSCFNVASKMSRTRSHSSTPPLKKVCVFFVLCS